MRSCLPPRRSVEENCDVGSFMSYEQSALLTSPLLILMPWGFFLKSWFQFPATPDGPHTNAKPAESMVGSLLQ